MKKTQQQQINVRKIIKEAVEAGLAAGYREKLAKVRNYYKSTEKLLYSLNALQAHIEMTKDYIEDLKKEGYAERSKDVVRTSSSGGQYAEKDEIHEGKIKAKEASIKRTQADIDWIWKGLEKIKDDEDYQIIEMKYFDELKIAEIAEKLNMSESTVKRRRSRIVNQLSGLLFGSDAVNLT